MASASHCDGGESGECITDDEIEVPSVILEDDLDACFLGQNLVSDDENDESFVESLMKSL